MMSKIDPMPLISLRIANNTTMIRGAEIEIVLKGSNM